MKHFQTFITTILFTIVASSNLFSQQTATLKAIEIRSTILNQIRPIYIYTPWQYNERDLVAFDVIYVFDAQNREIFDLVHSTINYVSQKRKFIVVGVASPAYDSLDYYRNSDYLPKPINISLEQYQTNKPNAENFWNYFSNEVMPFINNNYRTTGVNYLVGHSLSASFVLDKAISNNDSFKGFICISPNLAYDKNRLAEDFLNFDFNSTKYPKFLFISQADELTTWAKKWTDAYRKVKAFVNLQNPSSKWSIFFREYPEYNHQSTVVPSITESLSLLSRFIDNNPYILRTEASQLILKVTVPNKEDEVFITGNQESLGNWDPSKIKLKKTSDFEREISLKIQFPMEFKITKGTWETQGFTDQTTNDGENIVINNLKTTNLNLKVLSW